MRSFRRFLFKVNQKLQKLLINMGLKERKVIRARMPTSMQIKRRRIIDDGPDRFVYDDLTELDYPNW